MSNIVNMNELVDISEVRVDSSLSRIERVAEYNRQIKDPDHYICCGILVTAKHPKNGAPFEECLRAMAMNP